ncbi:MAG: MFS transporter, partial [Candidatus Thorarchaeota archaeon]
GDLGMMLSNMFGGVYIFQYYVYTINLDASLVSIGVSVQMLVSAVFGIIFGVIVDNKKPGKLGKRRPFLLLGLPVWFITSILTWFPPVAPEGNTLYFPTTIYFWVIILIRSISRSLLFNVYLSMLPEQSQTSKNRESVAAVRSAFSIIASVIALMFPLIIQSLLEDPKNAEWWKPSGKIVLFYIPIIGIGLAIFGLISVLLVFFAADESFYKKNNNYVSEKVSLKASIALMGKPINDNNFRYLVISGFFGGIAGKIVGQLVFPFQTYVLNITSFGFYSYVLISFFGKFAWYAFWMKMRKKNHIMKSYSTTLILAIIASFLGTLFFINFIPIEFQMILYIITWSTILGSMYSFPLFSIPLTAAMIHDAAEKSDEPDIDIAISKISGSYYGLAQFVRSLGPAAASLLIGYVLAGQNKNNPYLIIMLFCSIGIFYLVYLILIKRIKVKHISFFDHPSIEVEKEKFIA